MTDVDELRLRDTLLGLPPVPPTRPGYGVEVARQARAGQRRRRAAGGLVAVVAAILVGVGVVQLRPTALVADPAAPPTVAAPSSRPSVLAAGPGPSRPGGPPRLAPVTAASCARTYGALPDVEASLASVGHTSIVRCHYVMKVDHATQTISFVRDHSTVVDDAATISQVMAALAGTTTDPAKRFCPPGPMPTSRDVLAVRDADGRVGYLALDFCTQFRLDGPRHYLDQEAWAAVVALTR